MINSLSEKTGSFTYSFHTSKSPDEVLRKVLEIDQWWSGIHNEKITGSGTRVGDVFTFEAGNGAHLSKQEMVEFVPGRKVVWQVIESRLTFLSKTDEWTGTRIRFDVSKDEEGTLVTFVHEGLVPQVECYEACSSTWPKYLVQLRKKLS